MPKINPDDYDDDAVNGYSDFSDDDYEQYEFEGTDIFESDLDIETELVIWKKIREWGHPHIAQRWDQEDGLVFDCSMWFGYTANAETLATAPSIEQGLIKLLAAIQDKVFTICNSIK